MRKDLKLGINNCIEPNTIKCVMRQDSYIILVVIVSKRFLRQFLFALFYFQLDKVNVLSECKSEMLLYTVSAKSCHACAPQDRLKITHKFQYWAYTAAQAKYLGTYVFHNVMRLFQSLYKQFCKIIVLVEETTDIVMIPLKTVSCIQAAIVVYQIPDNNYT